MASIKQTDLAAVLKNVFTEDWMARAGIGGMLAAASLVALLYNWFLCLPLYVALWSVMIGYCLRCMRLKVADKNAKLPDWNDWGDLFISGITWMALQTAVWLLSLSAQILLFVFCTKFALDSSNYQLWCYLGTLLLFLTSGFLSMISSYTMVNFAVEENLKAGLAFAKSSRFLFAAPQVLIGGFLLASGIQFISIALPCITIIGIFLAPSVYFIGQIASSVVLASHWSSAQAILELSQSEK